ncbi:hypothetical protein M5K25_004221 [Dendrobium thyrsiflorum]|uniref:Uncharacterized protein n=1 Tax=Dendrobium thyrsiflorum TaxID=117978 RepID=A0ABD0VM90_DENTH
MEVPNRHGCALSATLALILLFILLFAMAMISLFSQAIYAGKNNRYWIVGNPSAEGRIELLEAECSEGQAMAALGGRPPSTRRTRLVTPNLPFKMWRLLPLSSDPRRNPARSKHPSGILPRGLALQMPRQVLHPMKHETRRNRGAQERNKSCFDFHEYLLFSSIYM